MNSQQLELLFPTFQYDLVRSRRKTLVIYVKEGIVEVRAPLKASTRMIRDFITEKTPWILKHLEDQRRRQRETLIIAQGRKVPFMGKTRTVQVILGTSNRVEIDAHYLYIHTRDRSPEKVSELYQKWLQRRAREYMATGTIKAARDLGVSHKLGEVVFRKTKSKWGHCCLDGTIQYNWLAMMAPKTVIDYLIAHEVSHLRHMNHSSRFWNTVERICPDYRTLRTWLGDNGHKLWLK